MEAFFRRLLPALMVLVALASAPAAAQAAPQLMIEDADGNPATEAIDPIPEGAQGSTTTASFTVLMSEPAAGDVTVAYSTVGGGGPGRAGSGQSGDFLSKTGTVTIPAGQTGIEVPIMIDVTINGDDIDEDNELFEVHLSSPTGGASVLDGIGYATIGDDDPMPTMSVGDATVVEGTGADRFIVFTVSLSKPSAKMVTVNYETVNGSATAPGDFTARTGQLTFSNGLTAQTVSITVKSDVADELDETLELRLKPEPVNASIADGTGVGTVSDDDGPQIVVDDPVLDAEGAPGESRQAVFTVKLVTQGSGGTLVETPSLQPVTVKVATANETASAPGDYTSLPAGTSVTIPTGQTRATVAVTVIGDDVDETDEKFRVTLSEAVGGSITDATGTATITDDDASPIMSIGDVRVKEGTGGTSSATFVVKLSKASGRAALIAYTTEDGTAANGQDFSAGTELLTFSPGETTKEIKIPVAPDQDVEEDETFSVKLYGGQNAGLDDDTGVATIEDDDLTSENLPTVGVNDATLALEGDEGTRPLAFKVTLSAPLRRTVSVGVATKEGSAKAGQDFRALVPARVTFAPGETSKTVPVDVVGDTAIEYAHTFSLELSEPVNARIMKASGLGTITDDDIGLTRAGGVAGSSQRGLTCRSGRACRIPVSWAVTVAGRVTFEVAGVRQVRLAARGKRPARTVTRMEPAAKLERRLAKAGAGKTTVVLTAKAVSRLKRLGVRELRLRTTFRNRQGGQQRRDERLQVAFR